MSHKEGHGWKPGDQPSWTPGTEGFLDNPGQVLVLLTGLMNPVVFVLDSLEQGKGQMEGKDLSFLRKL